MSQQVVYNGKTIKFGRDQQLGAGGQGWVCHDGHLAYKISHDISALIPEGKVLELAELKNIPGIMVPQGNVYDTQGRRIGFTMPYIKDTDFLSRVIAGTYKRAHNIDQNKLGKMITDMRYKLIEIHKRSGYLVVDYNEMNFLTDLKYESVYYIDTDAWLTPSYQTPEAIMHNVRDRRLPLGKFDHESDIFSYAVVSYMLYTGCHPYQGKCDGYEIKDFLKRMDDGVSHFHPKSKKKVKYGLMHKNMYNWYEGVFKNGDRSMSPIPGDMSPVIVSVQVTQSPNEFVSEVVMTFINSRVINNVQWHNNTMYITTDDGVYGNFKRINSDTGAKGVLFTEDNKMLTIDKKVFFRNGRAYEATVGGVIEYAAETLKEPKITKRMVSGCTEIAKVYNGCIIQNIFGKFSAIIPYNVGTCATVSVPEIDNTRIIDAWSAGVFLIVLYEKGGKYQLATMKFDKKFSKYTIRIEDGTGMFGINACMKQNGTVVINKSEDDLELFLDPSQPVVIKDSPIDGYDMYAYNDVYFVNGEVLYKIKKK